jgi:uncharacterized membrane protein
MNRALRSWLKYFLRGLLVIAPIALTFWILWRIFVLVDGLIPLPDLPYLGRGVGFALVIALVTIIGLLTTNLLAAQGIEVGQRVLGRLPFVKLLYTSIKDLTEAFVGQKKHFNRPVLVDLPGGIQVVGFVTRTDLTELGLTDRVAVFLPQAYNFAGNLLIVPREHVKALERPASEALAFVVSGGLTSPATRGAPSASASERTAPGRPDALRITRSSHAPPRRPPCSSSSPAPQPRRSCFPRARARPALHHRRRPHRRPLPAHSRPRPSARRVGAATVGGGPRLSARGRGPGSTRPSSRSSRRPRTREGTSGRSPTS